jgi:hypothetical protein
MSMQKKLINVVFLSFIVLFVTACGGGGDGPASPGETAPAQPPSIPESMPFGMMLGLSPFEVGDDGEVASPPVPVAARLDIFVRDGGRWSVTSIEDPASNVFHKGMVYDPGDRPAGILTLGGSGALLKLWRRGPEGFVAETIWERDFGGKFSRMRDAEIADLSGDGTNAIIVATHDQGVVAVVRPVGGDRWDVAELDQKKDTFVHEIELGDLDGDGVLEIYATPSAPNKLDGTPQPGEVVRYAPPPAKERTVVADLGNRHAKEILVDDVDGDGTDELYVVVEASRKNDQVEIRRYDAETDPAYGIFIAKIPDRLCRVLVSGDIDGDGRKEMIAAALRSGLWLLRPGDDPRAPWQATSIDKDSSGFEHAAQLADLDGDGIDELYVASDDQGEVRRYVWRDGEFVKQIMETRAVPDAVFTWNLMPVPVEMVR